MRLAPDRELAAVPSVRSLHLCVNRFSGLPFPTPEVFRVWDLEILQLVHYHQQSMQWLVIPDRLT